MDNSGVNHQWREAEFSAMARVTRLGLRRRAFCHLGSNSAGNELQSTGCIQIQMHGGRKSQTKSHSTLRAKRATFTYLEEKS